MMLVLIKITYCSMWRF